MKTKITNIQDVLVTVGLTTLISDQLCSENHMEGDLIGSKCDIVCVQTGNVYTYMGSYYHDGLGFYASNIESLEAFKNNTSITLEL